MDVFVMIMSVCVCMDMLVVVFAMNVLWEGLNE
jgi:hypothetical protein